MSIPEVRPPYVVSADGFELVQRWAAEEGYKAPSEAYFADYSLELEAALREVTGVNVDVIEHAEIKDGLDDYVAHSIYPVISLDRVYLQSNPNVAAYIDMTRAVDPEFTDLGLHPRPGRPDLNQQIEELRTEKEAPVVVVDDVIFTGEGIVDLQNRLKKVGRPVTAVFAGIGIGHGVELIKRSGIDVICLRIYDDVTDEVCQRDFLAAIPFSGRTVIGWDGQVWSAPYLQPFGNPEKWATIPKGRVKEFSRFCLGHSIALWDEVQKHSGMDVPIGLVPRVLTGMSDNGESITKFLGRHLNIGELITGGRGE